MSETPFATVALEGDLEAALTRLPPRAGVAQILGPEARNLLIGRPANLRRWAATHLGRGRPVTKGKRPPTNLSPIATAVAFAEARSSFHQRLLFERLMERHVPRAKRRDLKPAGWLRLDVEEPFPRLALAGGSEAALKGPHFGPFRDRRAADRALAALHKGFPLRPCDYDFEPAPDLPLGLGCLYAQVRSCAAPCLERVSEEAYRGLARDVGEVLAGRAPRPEELAPVLSPWVSAAGARGLVAVSGREAVEIHPVMSGVVLEEAGLLLTGTTVHADDSSLEQALGGLRFDPPPAGRDDWPWLLVWLAAQKRGAGYLVVPEGEPAAVLAGRVREVLS